jgi:hypothetical protein
LCVGGGGVGGKEVRGGGVVLVGIA